MKKGIPHLYAWWWASWLLLAPFLVQAQPSGAQKAATAKAATAIEQNFGQQVSGGKDAANAYPLAFRQLEAMLADKQPYSFKKAVFITENAFFDGDLSYEKFCRDIRQLTNLSKILLRERQLLYELNDKEEVAKYGAVFTMMTDTIPFLIKQDTVYHLPYRYDFEDVWGEKDWIQMFVTKLMVTRKGNCHSLPFLYKIIVEELAGKAYLAMAPSHIYIKHHCLKGGWYNTELTSASVPVDAWIMASGYINTDAIMNGLYMDTLSAKQSLAVCVTDLANGYQKRFGTGDGSFVLQCCELALRHYPNYANALLLKAETVKQKVERLMKRYGATYPKQIMNDPKAKSTFEEMQKTYVNIHQLGYRQMPKQMYMQWLAELNQEKAKYTNRNIVPTLQKK
jgi:hypothetical protein